MEIRLPRPGMKPLSPSLSSATSYVVHFLRKAIVRPSAKRPRQCFQAPPTGRAFGTGPPTTAPPGGVDDVAAVTGEGACLGELRCFGDALPDFNRFRRALPRGCVSRLWRMPLPSARSVNPGVLARGHRGLQERQFHLDEVSSG
ncbi:hypothetical protein MTO96_018381 [Rhipicephalus appendiculatus]